MFGYVKPRVGELLVKEHEFYKATYCGICMAMKRQTGNFSRVTLTYDSVFLALLRMAYMDDTELSSSMRRCFMHPMKKRCMLGLCSATEYTARAFAILTHYKLLDDLKDKDSSHRFAARCMRPVSAGASRRAEMSELAGKVKEVLGRIDALEREGCPSADIPATAFGELLGEVFSQGLEGEGALVLRQVGYHLGRFIYCADAAEDYPKDARSGSYNPYVLSYGAAELTDENRATIKRGLLLECTALEAAVNLIDFGKKTTVENIVRNIIYLGLPDRIAFLDPVTKGDGGSNGGKALK